MQTGSIEGSWNGWYGYSAKRLPTQFDVDFVFSDPINFTGRICDNGPMGDAVAPGSQVGQVVAFQKSYIQPLIEASSGKVYYTGQVSDDGNYMSGTWKLGILTGPWEMYRNTPNAYVPTNTVWPPPPIDYVAYTFNQLSSLPPMTARTDGSRLVLTKRHPPEMVGLESQILGTGILLVAVGLVQILNLAGIHLPVPFLSGVNPVTNVGMLAFVIWALLKSAPMIRMVAYGDIYVLDRAGNQLIRNRKTLASMSDINYVELKTTGASRVMNTVRIVLNSGRRIFVETGRPEDVSGVASSIAQFAGVQVVGA